MNAWGLDVGHGNRTRAQEICSGSYFSNDSTLKHPGPYDVKLCPNS